MRERHDNHLGVAEREQHDVGEAVQQEAVILAAADFPRRELVRRFDDPLERFTRDLE